MKEQGDRSALDEYLFKLELIFIPDVYLRIIFLNPQIRLVCCHLPIIKDYCINHFADMKRENQLQILCSIL